MKKHGGKRAKSGRKPVDDPKKGITIYLQQSVIEANGGVEEVKKISVFFLKRRKKIKTLKTVLFKYNP